MFDADIVSRAKKLVNTFPCHVYVCVCVLQMELEQCRRSLAEERRARLRAESKLREVLTVLIRGMNQSINQPKTHRFIFYDSIHNFQKTFF